jgi:hypothetical protein
LIENYSSKTTDELCVMLGLKKTQFNNVVKKLKGFERIDGTPILPDKPKDKTASKNIDVIKSALTKMNINFKVKEPVKEQVSTGA